MDRYSLADARAHWPELVAKIEAGEEVEIIRDGMTVARVVPQPARKTGKIDVEALRRLTAGQTMQTESAGEFIRKMRDEARY